MKKLAFLLCLLLAACLSACAPEQPADSSSQPEPVHITVAFWNAGVMQGDAFQRYVEERFGVVLEPVDLSYENYTQRLQQLAATDELPDIMGNDIMGTSAYESWISQNKIRAIPKSLSAYPNLQRYLDQPYNERFKRDNGSFYAIPRLTYTEEALWALDRCIMLRKDWMQKLDYTVPQSWEEFRQLLSAFVHDDPDGNGIDDTVGLTASHLNTLEAVYLNLFPELSNTERGWMYEDEKWMPVYCSKRVAPALETMRQLYQDGLLDPSIAYVSTQEAVNNFAKGKSGAICGQYYLVLNCLADLGMLDQAYDMVQILPTWPCEDGNRYRFTTSLHWSESYFGARVDDEKMDKILALYDWLLSDDFMLCYRYGIEGTDWVYEAGRVKALRQISPLREYPSLSILSKLVQWHQDEQYELSDYNELTYGRLTLANAREWLDWFRNHTKRVNYNYDIVFMSTQAKNSLVYNTVAQEKMLKVIVGQESALTAWPKALKEMEDSTTLLAAIDEVTAEARRLGVQP
ncbi:MAG: extracellular solute-binding protein [Eubacteriales bacterium]|nr:extracellular solute-binding protein [Eubacteriales bacterium]